ncbi:MAG: Gfo/Idh/MocA family oxidoreductase [Verrucomicrobia bacterium]|nr:Gfo/Idh/MocA family oxidoreductase [Verrucomicrobiota bacterium]MCG2681941.1 Gfo/Idh/MocA family oxidoreductase [Kiritimatiellia bacterium]MBU4247141.1 Gfo/Idh/MocA family oxidoreductase [Verrucomicrobiota bacterium]MBU4290982.1 Gfo/Idh/MocA family oxidoreductase [Verrucomicrobiota bacterium]MBU4430423.1 Gfo/Idh/MocA family oxidoreductase [Verrucomicrobiota bacterium]
MKKLRVGLAGCSRGQGIVGVFAAHPKVEVTALCDLNEKIMAETGKALSLPDSALHTTCDRFLDAPVDAVIIATPIKCHADHTVQALEAGKHVLCEQTMAYTVKDCRRVVNAVKKSHRTYMMAENYSYFHYIREWQKLVEAGKLGKIFYAEGEYLHEIINLLVNAKTGKYYWRHERPPIWYCAHTLGPLLMLMKDRIVKACGLTTGFNKMPKFKKHLGFLDFEIGLFKTQNGSVIKILRSQVVSRPHLVWYSIFGTKGHLENGRLSEEGLTFIEKEMDKHHLQTIPTPIVDPNAPEEAKKGGHGTSEYYMIRDFLNAVESGTRPPIDAVKAADMTIPGLVAHESAMRGGKWMDVPLMHW